MPRTIDISIHAIAPDKVFDVRYGHVIVRIAETREDWQTGEDIPSWPRNESYPKNQDMFGICWAAQLDNSEDKNGEPYGYSFGIGDCTAEHPMPYDAIERVIPHMRKMQRSFDATRDKYGERKSFPEYVAAHLSKYTIRDIWYRGPVYGDKWERQPGTMLSSTLTKAINQTYDFIRERGI